MRRRREALLACLALLAAGPAAAGRVPFRFERTVEPGAAGPNRLEPDAPLLARSLPLEYEASGNGERPGVFQRGLADLRFYDGSGREVPFLLIPPRTGAPEWRPGRLLPIAPTKTASGFEVDLGAVAAVDRLRLEGLHPPFLKRLRLEGGGDRSRWTLLVDQGTVFDLPEEGLARTDIDFPAGEYRYLRLTWNDASSGRLRLPGAALARLSPAAGAAPPAAAFPIAVERLASEPGKSRFRLRLPGPGLPLVAIELVVPGGGPLLRRAEVGEGRLQEQEIAPVRLGETTLRRTVRGGIAASDLRVPIARPLGRDLELMVMDGSNPPLELAGVRAELAPLPWIYFEAASLAPLTARFGNPDTAPPSYDLEALRELAAHGHPAAARWGEVRALAPASAAADAAPVPRLGAPIEAGEFRFARGIREEPPGLASLILDTAVLAHCAVTLGDLRIVDSSGRQVPYVLERRDEPLSLPLGELTRAARKGDPATLSRYTLRLPYATLPASRLLLITRARVFEREVRLLQPADPERNAAEERVLAALSWRNADPDTPAPPLAFELPAGAGDRFEIAIDEGDNAPLPLDAPRLLLTSYRLRYFPPAEGGTHLELLYGRPGLGPPRYDLALFTARLLGDSAREVSLLPEPKPGAVRDAAAVPRTVFWLALGGAVVALLILLARLLRAPAGGGA